jgi:general secretion pathway protein K
LTRDRNPFEKVQDFLQHDALAGLKVEVAGIGVESSYFLIEGDVRMGRLLLRHRSVMHRPQKGGVQVIRRSRKGVFDG